MKVIENLKILSELESYIDSLHALLKVAGLFEGPKYLLYGMTGMAFKFVSHKNMISPSRYMYHLEIDSWKAVDRLGIYSEIYFGNKHNPTFPLYQTKAIERIKESIDKGIPAIFWDPGLSMFAVIFGYDDEDEAFFYKDRFQSDEQIILYKNLGKVDTTFWVCQVFGDKIDKDIRDIYIDSLDGAVYEWEKHDNVPEWTRNDYASGRLAYDYIINALEKNDFHERGARSILTIAVKSKESISQYLAEVIKEFPSLNKAFIAYQGLNEIYKNIDQCMINMYDNTKLINKALIPKLVNYLKEAKLVEEKGISEIKIFLKEFLYNKYINFYDVNKYGD